MAIHTLSRFPERQGVDLRVRAPGLSVTVRTLLGVFLNPVPNPETLTQPVLVGDKESAPHPPRWP